MFDRERRPLYAVLAAFAALLIAYSQTWAYTGDEGFHLLAAQLIRHGMRPYLDFCFPQAPLNAFWNAGWMALLGESWRIPHLLGALFTVGAVALASGYVFRYFPLEAPWRAPAAVGAALLIGLNAQVFGYGALAQAYGMCLFLTFAAFRLAVRPGAASAAGAGLLSSAAAASSLLAAPAAPVLLLWIFFHRSARRWTHAAAFLAATTVPWLPALWLYLQGPRQTWFNLVEYHARYRRLYWPETTQHDLEVMASSIDSGQALLLGALALGGLAWVLRRSDWPRELKSQIYLCGWIALAIVAALGAAHPTFPRYYLLVAPFVAVPAAAGLYVAGSRLFAGPKWPLALVLLLTAAGLAKSLYERRTNFTLPDYEAIARKIESVTPPGGKVFANEMLYFMMRRRPLPGLEFYYDRLVPLPPAELARLHILPQAEIDRLLAAGTFATVYYCEDEDSYNKLGLPKLYRHQDDVEDCVLFWDRK